jgi:site-specific DNA recombinase
MLRNPIYTGILTVEKWAISVEASFEPLVSRETFNRIQDLLQGRRNTITPRQRNRNEFPLRNFVRCGNCHKPLTGSPSTGKMGVKYLYYRCQNRGCPTPINVRTEVLHQHFVEFLRQQEPDKAFLAMFHKVVLHEWNVRQADAADRVRGVERQIEKLKERKRKLLQALIYDQTLTRAEYVEMRRPLDTELAFAEDNARLARAAEVEVDTVLDFAESLLLNIAGAWERCTLDQKQRLQQVVFPRGVDYADGLYRTQQTSLLFKGLGPFVGCEEGFGSATGNRTRV